MALFYVLGAASSIGAAAGELLVKPLIYLAGIRRIVLKLNDQLLQGITAPAASCPGSLALSDLAWNFDPMNADVVDDLSPSDMETETEIIVRFHRRSLVGQFRMPPNSLKQPAVHWLSGRCAGRIQQ